ncbi:hypothetical protein BDF21DRAFT_400952 [Thamnidium elegans]|nr:hypothetical protein BDF21DRAFT_400952 [Thamnidium elegans]
MDPVQLEQALNELPHATLITEIPEIQNAIAHLLKSNQEMREYDPNDPDLIEAIKENKDLITRKEAQIDLTLKVIRERMGEAAWREMGSNVKEFRDIHKQELLNNKPDKEEEGVFL